MSINKLYTKLIIESIISRKPLRISYVSRDLIRFARMNKVLYLLGYYDKRIRDSRVWLMLNKRCKEQRRVIIEIAQIAESLGVDILIVKTLKPFKYAPDDIDILVINNEDHSVFINSLLKRGYILHKKGTPEVTLRRLVNGIIIDLDIHVKMGAGPYEYIDKHYLWKRRIYKELDSMKIPVPNDVDELLIMSAHAIMKEFMITIADITHILFLDGTMIMKAKKQSTYIGLSQALQTILRLTDRIINLQCKDKACPVREYEYQIEFPVKVPITTIICTYLENLKYRLKIHGLRPINELMKAPSSKGTKTILRYLGI